MSSSFAPTSSVIPNGIPLFALSEAETREALQQGKTFKSVMNDHGIDINYRSLQKVMHLLSRLQKCAANFMRQKIVI